MRVLIETLCKLPRALHVDQTFTDVQAGLNILRRCPTLVSTTFFPALDTIILAYYYV